MRVRIHVDEPWDFTSPDGEGILYGTLVADEIHGKEWVIIECSPFVMGEICIHNLIVTNRHELPHGSTLMSELIKGNQISISAAWRHDGKVWEPTLVPEAIAKGTLVGSWLIGGIRKV